MIESNQLPGDPSLPPGVTHKDIETSTTPAEYCNRCGVVLLGPAEHNRKLCDDCYFEGIPDDN